VLFATMLDGNPRLELDGLERAHLLIANEAASRILATTSRKSSGCGVI
jgi:hypothetical protein